MNRVGDFLRWLGTPLRTVRGWFPFSPEGRQTLVYLVFAGAGPTLTLFVLWAMGALRDAKQWEWFARMSFWILGGSLLIIVCGLAMFVSVRAVKIGKDGLETEGWRGGAEEAADKVAVAAIKSAAEIKEDGHELGSS